MDNDLQITVFKVPKHDQAHDQSQEIELVSCSVVNSDRVSERVTQVNRELLVSSSGYQLLATGFCPEQSPDQVFSLSFDFPLKGAKGFVPVPLWLLDRRHLVHPLVYAFEQSYYCV